MVPGYVQPSGVIKLYRGVPLSPDHADVLYITSEEQALNYLYNYSAREFTQESYTRGESGVLKIKETADALMLYNYLSWSNNWPNGQKKYFFAFITSVNYINNNCTAIDFVVDNYMTWFPHLQLGQCRVHHHPSEKCWQAPGLWFMVTTRASTIMTSVAASLSVVGTRKPSHLSTCFSGLWALAIMNGLTGTFLSKNDSSAFRKNIQSTFTRTLSQACK